MINILLVSNSAVDKGLLQSILNKKPQLKIIGAVNNEISELQALPPNVQPDVILVLQQSSTFPCNKEGIRFLRKHFDAPIIVFTSDPVGLKDITNIHILPKIELRPTSKEFTFWLNELITMIRKVTSDTSLSDTLDVLNNHNATAQPTIPAGRRKKAEIIAIGSSTGGPQTLNAFLPLLPGDLKIPVVIVQHMPPNFLPILIGWLQSECPLPIEIARDNEPPLGGHVYFAPDHYHLTISKRKKFKLVDAPPMHNVKPAASYLFKSVAEVYGSNAIGILLTGMGKDGAKELALIKEKGGITFAQNKETSIIFGMPKEAIRLNGAVFVLSPNEIARKLREFV